MGYLHNRHSIRLPGYDYSQPNAYFVTICTKNRENLFGDIENGETRVNEVGKIIDEEWIKTFKCRNYLGIDEYIIMPNHFHAIVWIMDNGRGTARRAPTVERFGKPTKCSLPTIIRSFKSAVTQETNLRNPLFGIIWQRNYFETVIRSEPELFAIRKYIVENPLKWEIDQENQKNCVNVGARRAVPLPI